MLERRVQLPDADPPLIAHRGYALRYPENTLIAVEAALAAGARYVEVDVQVSADEVPVLFHDRTLERLCGVPGQVHEYSLEQLKAFRAQNFSRFGYKFAATRIPTLAEFCQLIHQHPQVTAFVEVKQEALDQFGIPLLIEKLSNGLQGVAAQSVVISFSLDFLRAMRPRWPSIGAVVEHWRDRRTALAVAPDYLFCDVRGLPRFGRLRANAQIAVYEVDDPRVALRLIRRGASLIETFAFGEMHETLPVLLGASSG